MTSGMKPPWNAALAGEVEHTQNQHPTAPPGYLGLLAKLTSRNALRGTMHDRSTRTAQQQLLLIMCRVSTANATKRMSMASRTNGKDADLDGDPAIWTQAL
jgi:hypothetical protein